MSNEIGKVNWFERKKGYGFVNIIDPESKLFEQDVNSTIPADIVINSTSAGTLNEEILLPENLFKSKPKVYDLTYSKEETSFNEMAKKEGSKEVYDGLGMLIQQAALSFEIWNKFKPNTNDIEHKIRA